ncbi:tetratricopeptide repeat protein [Candidatus Albibeggiatoa sp. nov. BB20]|uniref:tetratricopeptide repeat protein n=1 Tax=Candidatus Albibeggiatoa sp. nov. BB20 TaxID=3162723 RepID=UPI0033656BB0
MTLSDQVECYGGGDTQAERELEYQSLLNGVSWSERFGLFFVECSPAQGKYLYGRLTADLLGQKQCQLLELSDPVDDLLPELGKANLQDVDVLFVMGLERSFVQYVGAGTGGQGSYYREDSVPRVLGCLNLGREKLQADYPELNLVFLLPPFGMKYFIRRAADFFDWREGKFKFPTELEAFRKGYKEIIENNDFENYQNLTNVDRICRLFEIEGYLDELQPEQAEKADLILEKIKILSLQENYKQMLEAVDEFLDIKSDDVAWYIQGFALGKLGRYKEAIVSYDKALNIKPDNYKAWNNRGNALGQLGRNEEAIASYDKALNIKPDKHEAWYNRGNALGQLGRNEESIASYDKALNIKPDYISWNNRGFALGQLGHNEEAIASYDKALHIKPDYDATWNNRGNALNELGRYEEAIASYDKALNIKPDDNAAWNNRGNALGQLGRNEEAIASYDKALNIKPDDDAAWYNRGFSLDELGRNEEAIASYNKALNIKPDMYEAWNNRGFALNELGRYEEAIASYDKALNIKPDEHKAWYNKACTYSLWRKTEEALQTLKKAIKLKKYKEMAKTDDDFKPLHNDPRFWALIGEE